MTRSADTRLPGRLTVEVRSDSAFLGQALPIEVRDSRLRLVATLTAGRNLDLPAGLYEVGAVLEDGHRHSEIVEVAGGKSTPVSLSLESESTGGDALPQAAPAESSAKGSVEHIMTAYQQPHYTREMASASETAAGDGLDAAADTHLVEVHGASLIRETQTLWVFQCAPNVDAVPTALFQVGARRLRISLPISPQKSSPSGSCAVKFERAVTGVHAQAWITPERKVANALQNMLSAGYLSEAAKVADDALDLLRFKYEDPTGAALGALLLQKVGRLQSWANWVENLARDFAWLPDGKVLLAQLSYQRGETSDAMLELALQASRQRVLFAESFSLLLELLRRWPAQNAGGARKEALDRLAGTAPYVDWESVCLSEWLQGR